MNIKSNTYSTNSTVTIFYELRGNEFVLQALLRRSAFFRAFQFSPFLALFVIRAAATALAAHTNASNRVRKLTPVKSPIRPPKDISPPKKVCVNSIVKNLVFSNQYWRPDLRGPLVCSSWGRGHNWKKIEANILIGLSNLTHLAPDLADRPVLDKDPHHSHLLHLPQAPRKGFLPVETKKQNMP